MGNTNGICYSIIKVFHLETMAYQQNTKEMYQIRLKKFPQTIKIVTEIFDKFCTQGEH